MPVRSMARIPGRKRNAEVIASRRGARHRRGSPGRRTRAATGPVSANEIGTSPIEMNQSRLDTRPSSRPGMRRCFVVVHTIGPAASSALKTKLAAMSCHGKSRQPVPGDHERRDGPGDVHERDVPRGIVPVPHHDRREHGADAAEREDEPEVAGGPPSSFFTRNGSSTSAGPRRSGTRASPRATSPTTTRGSHEPEPLGDLVRHRRVAGVVDRGARGTPADRRAGSRRHEERGRVDQERGAGAATEHRDDPPADAGPSMRNSAGRTNWSSEFAWRAVRVRDRARPRRTRDRRTRCRRRSRRRSTSCARSGCAGHGEHAERAHREHPDRVGGDEHLAPFEPVAHGPADQQEHTCGTVCATPISASAVGAFESS